SGTPEWKGVRLDGVDDIAERDGGAEVTFGVIHRISEHDATLARDVIHQVRLEDRLDLVSEGATWRLASEGGTLGAAGLRFDKPRAARRDTPEHAVRDYLLGLSGGPVDICPIVSETIDCEHGR